MAPGVLAWRVDLFVGMTVFGGTPITPRPRTKSMQTFVRASLQQ
jgi:hypothetical protein